MTITALVRQSAVPAAIASAATTATVAGLTKLHAGSGSAGINAVSHILWGDKAALKDGFSAQYTLVGAGLNSAAIGGWAALHELIVAEMKVPHGLLPRMVSGSAVSLIAYVTDYHIVPKRLTPGFEKRLTPRGLVIVYGALAVGLALGSLLARPRRIA